LSPNLYQPHLLLWPFVQAIAPLKNLYGDVADAFIQNSRAVQVFAVSDEATTKFVSEKLGEHRTGNAAQRPPLRTPTEISREVSAESDCQYVIRAGAAPLFLKKVRYYESDELFKPGASIPEWIAQRWYPFAGRYDPDPDHSPQK
jgi:type IV secretory pathway TraG/TraD family ATPase VirD4